jgi:hypothetical protein
MLVQIPHLTACHSSHERTTMYRPTAREAAEYFHQVARQAVQRGDEELARHAYRNCIQSWFEATMRQPAFIERLREAEDDFSEFARKDGRYLELLKIVKAYATQYPGIKETVLSAILDRVQPDDISYVLHFGQKHGEILQTPKGEIYELKLPPSTTA